MKNPLRTVCYASEEVLKNKNYLKSFTIISLVVVSVYILLPVFTIPGNNLLFQLGVFTVKDYFLIVSLSLLVGLMITMQVYSYKKTKSLQAGKSVLGGSSGIVAGLFGTASCSSCLTSLFGFLGASNVLFLAKHQWYVVGVSGLFVLVSLYITSKNIVGECKSCESNERCQ